MLVGTASGAGPLDTVNVTRRPVVSSPGAGCWSMTVPGGSGDARLAATVATMPSALLACAIASPSTRPMRFGTEIGAAPLTRASADVAITTVISSTNPTTNGTSRRWCTPPVVSSL